MTVLANYADVVSYGLQNEKCATVWHNVMAAIRKRRDLESQIIKECRTTNPGMSFYEVLDKYSNYIEKNAPIPSYPIIVD